MGSRRVRTEPTENGEVSRLALSLDRIRFVLDDPSARPVASARHAGRGAGATRQAADARVPGWAWWPRRRVGVA